MTAAVREAAFLAIKQLSRHLIDAIRAIQPEMTDVNVYAERLEPGWLERAPSAKVAVEHLLLNAAEELESVPLILRLMDAVGIDPTVNRPEVDLAPRESIRGSYAYVSDDAERSADLMLFAARSSLLAVTLNMWTRQLVSARDPGSMLYPGWRAAGGFSPTHRAAGPKLMDAITAYVTADETRWRQAQADAEAGLSIVVARVAGVEPS